MDYIREIFWRELYLTWSFNRFTGRTYRWGVMSEPLWAWQVSNYLHQKWMAYH